MGQVSIAINDQAYSLSCDDGEEARLTQLAESVRDKVDGLVRTMGQIGDQRLLLMAAILLADELDETHAQTPGLKTEKSSDTAAQERTPEAGLRDDMAEARQMLEAAALNAVAKRIEDVAAAIESA